MVDDLNILRVTKPFKLDRNSLEMSRRKPVIDAIGTLITSLPNLITGMKQARAPHQYIHSIENLLEATRVANSIFIPLSPGRRNEPWKDVAALIYFHLVRSGWKSPRREKIGIGRDTPVVKLVALALGRIGINKNPRTIEMALYRHHLIDALDKEGTQSGMIHHN